MHPQRCFDGVPTPERWQVVGTALRYDELPLKAEAIPVMCLISPNDLCLPLSLTCAIWHLFPVDAPPSAALHGLDQGCFLQARLLSHAFFSNGFGDVSNDLLLFVTI